MRKDIESCQDTEQSDCKIVGLEIIRRVTFEYPKTYGNVPPEEMTRWYVDESSQKIADRTKGNILKLVQHRPDELPEVITGLINSGKYFESIKYVVPMEKDSWVDGELSSRMVTETVLEIGEKALPFLEKSEEEYAKNLAKRLRRDITSKKIKESLKKLLPQKK